ncbi:hypothetical protein C8Q79DRAFT_977783 [Trametes meyenii]|nr:hypothetical protein C8Q79DRAFT_977783 [Trametes meyenii]
MASQPGLAAAADVQHRHRRAPVEGFRVQQQLRLACFRLDPWRGPIVATGAHVASFEGFVAKQRLNWDGVTFGWAGATFPPRERQSFSLGCRSQVAFVSSHDALCVALVYTASSSMLAMNAGPRGIWGGGVITPVGDVACLFRGIARRRSPQPDSMLRAGEGMVNGQTRLKTKWTVTQKGSGAVPEPDPARKESRAQGAMGWTIKCSTA